MDVLPSQENVPYLRPDLQSSHVNTLEHFTFLISHFPHKSVTFVTLTFRGVVILSSEIRPSHFDPLLTIVAEADFFPSLFPVSCSVFKCSFLTFSIFRPIFGSELKIFVPP